MEAACCPVAVLGSPPLPADGDVRVVVAVEEAAVDDVVGVPGPVLKVLHSRFIPRPDGFSVSIGQTFLQHGNGVCSRAHRLNHLRNQSLWLPHCRHGQARAKARVFCSEGPVFQAPPN